MRLAHYGTFDVDNYGDLLFPKIIEWRLPDWKIQHISPTKTGTRFEDAAATQARPDGRMQAYVTGGGNIFNFRSTPLQEYAAVSREAYARLVIEPFEHAQRHKVPYLINSPSLSAKKHTFLEKIMLSQILGSADYISFRDTHSVHEAQCRTNQVVHCVPDTALDVARMWPVYEQAEEGNYATIHVNRRYGGTAREIASALDRIGAQTGLTILLLPVGPCHGDIDFMHEVSGHLTTSHICHEQYSLRGFAEIIAGGRMYLGSSMHGFITSLSYDRPCLLVLGPQVMEKFKGLLDLCGLSETAIMRDWREAADKNCPVVRMTAARRTQIFSQLDEHWERFRAELGGVSRRKRFPIAPLMPLVNLSQKSMGLRTKLKRRFQVG